MSVVEYPHTKWRMYLGCIVENGTVDDVLGSPKASLTRRYCGVPSVDPATRREIIRLRVTCLHRHPPVGCHFHPRCRRRCRNAADLPRNQHSSRQRTRRAAICTGKEEGKDSAPRGVRML